MISASDFTKLFSSRYWKKIGESAVPHSDQVTNKKKYLEDLHRKIAEKNYQPSTPRDYIVANKHNGVARIIPAFSREDCCVYFFTIKMIEQFIAQNRVEGTFGGWSLGNPIKIKEEEELLSVEYSSYFSFNSYAWISNWKDFQKKAYEYSRLQESNFYLKFDIANFYDTINLTILKNRIRHVVPKTYFDIIELLFYFLENWNKAFQGYSAKTVGLPADEIGDCSRILANFYLQDYDLKIKQLCDEYGARYLRYADDQILFTKNENDAQKILLAASKELFKINLNINSSKVDRFDSLTNYDIYWAFSIFNELDKPNGLGINKAVEILRAWENNDYRFRTDSVLKRLLNVNPDNLTPENKYYLMAKFTEKDFATNLDPGYWLKLTRFLGNKEDVFRILDESIDVIEFNQFHYFLAYFYRKHRSGHDLTRIIQEINKRKIRHD